MLSLVAAIILQPPGNQGVWVIDFLHGLGSFSNHRMSWSFAFGGTNEKFVFFPNSVSVWSDNLSRSSEGDALGGFIVTTEHTGASFRQQQLSAQPSAFENGQVILSSPRSASSLLKFARLAPVGPLRSIRGGGWTVGRSDHDERYLVANSSGIFEKVFQRPVSPVICGANNLFVGAGDGWMVLTPNGKSRYFPQPWGLCWDKHLGPIFYSAAASKSGSRPITTFLDLHGKVITHLNADITPGYTDLKSHYILGVRWWNHFGGDLCEWQNGKVSVRRTGVDFVVSRNWDFYWQ